MSDAQQGNSTPKSTC